MYGCYMEMSRVNLDKFFVINLKGARLKSDTSIAKLTMLITSERNFSKNWTPNFLLPGLLK